MNWLVDCDDVSTHRKKTKIFQKKKKKHIPIYGTHLHILYARFANKRPPHFFCYIRTHIWVFILWLRKLHFLFWSIDNNAIVIVDVRAISFRTMLIYMNEYKKKLMSSEQKTQKQTGKEVEKNRHTHRHT